MKQPSMCGLRWWGVPAAFLGLGLAWFFPPLVIRFLVAEKF